MYTFMDTNQCGLIQTDNRRAVLSCSYIFMPVQYLTSVVFSVICNRSDI